MFLGKAGAVYSHMVFINQLKKFVKKSNKTDKDYLFTTRSNKNYT